MYHAKKKKLRHLNSIPKLRNPVRQIIYSVVYFEKERERERELSNIQRD